MKEWPCCHVTLNSKHKWEFRWGEKFCDLMADGMNYCPICAATRPKESDEMEILLKILWKYKVESKSVVPPELNLYQAILEKFELRRPGNG